MSDFPTDPKKLRARIRSYERKLRQEKQEYGGVYDDSYGKRYLLCPLYLMAGDLKGCLESLAWFEREFPDDGGEHGQCLCWALALYRAGKTTEAERKLRQAMLMNVHMLPRLLGRKVVPLKIRKDGFDLHLMDLNYMPPEYFALWTEAEKVWAEKLFDGQKFQATLKRYLEIEEQLEHVEPSPERTALVNEQSMLAYGKSWL